MSEGPKCKRSWIDDYGKDHHCDKPEGHTDLTCICECGERKWNGKPLPKKWMPK